MPILASRPANVECGSHWHCPIWQPTSLRSLWRVHCHCAEANRKQPCRHHQLSLPTDKHKLFWLTFKYLLIHVIWNFFFRCFEKLKLIKISRIFLMARNLSIIMNWTSIIWIEYLENVLCRHQSFLTLCQNKCTSHSACPRSVNISKGYISKSFFLPESKTNSLKYSKSF